jgi:hypothetical protein
MDDGSSRTRTLTCFFTRFMPQLRELAFLPVFEHILRGLCRRHNAKQCCHVHPSNLGPPTCAVTIPAFRQHMKGSNLDYIQRSKRCI